ncbi:MAG: tetratricopeptide repeat protein, partial [Planctomycetota bacterium]
MGLLRPALHLSAALLLFCGTACSSILGEHEPPLEEADVQAPVEPLVFLPDLLQAQDRTLLPEPVFQKAMDALGAGDPRQASILLNGLRDRAPHHLELARLHAWALLQSGDARAAVKELTAFSRDQGGDDAGLAYVMAHALWELGRKAESAPWFRKVLETRPNDLALLEKAAQASYAAGDGAFAVRAIDRILVRQPLTPGLALMRARALAVDGRWEPSLALYDRLLLDRGDDSAFWDEAGLVAFQSALAGGKPVQFRAAAGYFQRAIQIAPQDARIQYNLACCLDWSGNHPAAVEAYERAIELQPDYWKAVENL